MTEKSLNCLFKTWRHSREEDHDGVTVYRPAGYKFPPARGRDGLEVRPDGTFFALDPGPDDRGRSTPGSWKREGDDVRVATGPSTSKLMTIVDCNDQMLKVRWK
jgi:hypothetical protein